MKRASAGWAAQAAMMVVLGVSAVITIGLWSRRSDLGFEGRGLCRLRAHWAAEAAVAQAHAQLELGFFPGKVQGRLQTGDPRVEVIYWLRSKKEGRLIKVQATGSCRAKGDRKVEKRLRVEFQGAGRRWRLDRWSEGAPPPTL